MDMLDINGLRNDDSLANYFKPIKEEVKKYESLGKARKMVLLDSKPKASQTIQRIININFLDDEEEHDIPVLIFAHQDEGIIIKWIKTLNYFIKSI